MPFFFMTKNLKDISIQFLKGVGPSRAEILSHLGIVNMEDLLYFFPRRYEDRRNLIKLAQVKIGEWQTVTGKVVTQGSRRSWFTKKHVTEIILDDGSGRIFCVWFNQPYLDRYFKEGAKVICYGKVDMYKNRIQMVSPEYEIIDDEDEENLSVNRIVPIYSLTKGVSQRFLRKTIKSALEKFKEDLQDELPVALRNKHKISNIKRSIENIHFPENDIEQAESIKRVSFEEFFFFQVSVILRRLSITRQKGIVHKISDVETLRFIESFPFKFTSAQKRVIREIREDMLKPTPMLRLLQGDVGSGKTVVAIFGCYAAFLNENQSCIMAPTEILARQHYEKIQSLIESGVLKNVRVRLLINSISSVDKKVIYEEIKRGLVHIIIGTHALFSENVEFKNLSFVVIDEQHKFGVKQRALLTEKGKNPDVLVMTATPIPRTLCITLYGDLDVSVIDELPPGRPPIKTFHYPCEQAEEVYKIVREKLKAGAQIYVVYPIIEESEKLDIKAAQDMYKHFTQHEFKDFKIGIIHGQMKSAESTQTMIDFKNGKINLLVATSVLEVGVDVPNASVMVIEHAERFGLSSLHQLRGRIGRGSKESSCYLLADLETLEAQKRIEAMLATTDGFKIAQVDLEIRGPGQFFGRHQHGLSELRISNPAKQMDTLILAREEALSLTKSDPSLSKEGNERILEVVKKRYPNYLENVTAG